MRGRRLLLPLALVVVAGCASTPPLADRPPPAGVPVEQHVLATLAKDLEGFKTLRANVEGDAPQGSFSGVIFVDRERRAFHLVTWKLAGAIPIFDMLVKDGTMRLCVPRAGKVLVRRVEERGGGDRVPLDALEAAVLGAPGGVSRTAEEMCVGGTLRPGVVDRRGDGLYARYTLEPGTLAVELQQIGRSGSTTPLWIAYADHEALPGGRYAPRALTVWRQGGDDKALTLRFSDMIWDAPIDAKKFEQRTPPDTVEVKTFAELELE